MELDDIPTPGDYLNYRLLFSIRTSMYRGIQVNLNPGSTYKTIDPY